MPDAVGWRRAVVVFHECVFDELQLGAGNRAKRCLSEDRPLGLLQPGRDKLKLSDDVIEDDFTSTPDSRIWDLSPMRLGAAKTQGNRRYRWMIKRKFVELYFTRGS